MGTVKKTSTTPAKSDNPVKPPATDSGKPISTFSVGDEVMVGSDKYRITGKGKTKVSAMKLFTDYNNNTYGTSRDEIPGTTKVKLA